VREKFVFSDPVSAIEWSPDDAFIYAVMAKKNEIHVRCLNPSAVESGKEGWTCTITESILGLEGHIWAPDSRSIITFSDL
jgi:hypothetical protein